MLPQCRLELRMVGRHDGSMGQIEPLALGDSAPRAFQPKDPRGVTQLLIAFPKIQGWWLPLTGTDSRNWIEYRG